LKNDLMKRDMALIRLMLLQVEGEQPSPDLSAYSEEQQVYHSALLIEAGFTHGQIITGNQGEVTGTITLRLTWHGHEFLDAARNDTIWKKAGEHIKKSGVQVTMTILEEMLKRFLKEALGLP
jgi:hypothetical protein